MGYENTFVREVKEHNMTDPFEILNWYRNLYHTEDNHTEHGIMAYAINDAFMVYKNVVPKSEVESLQVELDAMRGAANSYKMHYENLATEIFEEIKSCMEELFDFFRQDNDIRESCAIMFALSEIIKLQKRYENL